MQDSEIVSSIAKRVVSAALGGSGRGDCASLSKQALQARPCNLHTNTSDPHTNIIL